MANKKRAANARTIYGRQEQVLVGLMILLAITIGLYIYFISHSILNVVLREEMRMDIAATHSRIGELESDYLHKKYAIDKGYAESLGFTPVTGKHFVARDPNNLTFNQ